MSFKVLVRFFNRSEKNIYEKIMNERYGFTLTF